MGSYRKQLHLVVLFTYEVSLNEWVKMGLVSRELLTYKKMIKDGHKVTLFTYGDRRDLEHMDLLNGINIVPVYKDEYAHRNRWVRVINSLALPFKFRQLFKSADILKTNQMGGSWVAVLSGWLLGKPVVVRCGFEMLRNMLRDERQKVKKWIKGLLGYLVEFFTFALADAIILSNISDFQFVRRFYPLKHSKIRLVRNFIDISIFKKNESSIKEKAKKDGTALYIGRIVERKNIESLIQAVDGSGFELDLVGQGNINKFLENCSEKEKIRHLGIVNNKDLPDLINRYDVIVLPSLYENNPKSLLEAMACGVVVVGTDVEGIQELIQDGVTGILCGTSPNSIRVGLDRAFALTDKQKRQMGIAARNFVVSHCSVEGVYRREMAIYRKMLSYNVARGTE